VCCLSAAISGARLSHNLLSESAGMLLHSIIGSHRIATLVTGCIAI